MTNTTQTQENRTMLTDLYQLTMNAGYFRQGKNDQAVFDLFLRKLPKDWGFFIANGIEDAMDYATNIHFTEEDIEFLQPHFDKEYLESLRNLRFTGDIYAVREGTPVGENTPLIRIHGPRMEAQLLESMLLNTVNFQTLIASKAHRVVRAAGKGTVMDFGLRRAQEKDAAMKGARAAYLAGAIATSNVLAGKEYEIPISGTMAHSFVMTFPTELEAFRAYAATFKNRPTLLVDTYDTMKGIDNAIIVAKELERDGNRLGGVRLDSGDLADLSKKAREKLNAANLDYVKIVASNDLNEYKIEALKNAGAQIDGFGVGTEMITAKPTAAIPGVYKLVADEAGAKIKLSAEKKSFPGIKQVFRCFTKGGEYSHDVLALEGEKIFGRPLLEKVVERGNRITPRRSMHVIREYCHDEIANMPKDTKQLFAQPYEIKISAGLEALTNELHAQYGGLAE